MSYKNPQDGSPAYVVKFNHEQKEIDNMKKFVVEQFANKDSKVETAEKKQKRDNESDIYFKYIKMKKVKVILFSKLL